MLSGKVPFPGNSELEIIGNVIKGDFHFNHEPFQRHSKESRDFLMNLIQKDVQSRFTASEAFNHPWIQDNSLTSEQSMPPQAFQDMSGTLDKIKVRKAVLLYLS